MRIVSGSILTILLGLAFYVMAAEHFNLRSISGAEGLPDEDRISWPTFRGGYASRERSRLFGAFWRDDPWRAREVIQRSSTLYPLDAFQWLDLAQISVDQGMDVDDLLSAAGSVQPFNRFALWEATQIALLSGNEALAERQLRDWLRDHPGDTERALFVGRRWISTPGELIDRVLPQESVFVETVLRVARRQRDFALADAAWQRLDPRPEFKESAFLDYVETLLDAGHVSEAKAIWKDAISDVDDFSIFNGSFDRPFGDGLGFNWRTDRIPGGVRVERDLERFASAPASLKIEFGGKDNVYLASPTIRIPVEPDSRIKLVGVWRAQGLTTRARPYLLITAEGAGAQSRLDVPSRSFDWQAFELDLDVPESTKIIQLMVRRDRTRDFDRYIEGSLWLDDLRIETVQTADVAAADPELLGSSQ